MFLSEESTCTSVCKEDLQKMIGILLLVKPSILEPLENLILAISNYGASILLRLSIVSHAVLQPKIELVPDFLFPFRSFFLCLV